MNVSPGKNPSWKGEVWLNSKIVKPVMNLNACTERYLMAEFNRYKEKPTPEAFIDGATVDPPKSEAHYPWERCNPQIPKFFNLRINEVTLAKLRYINEHRPGSMQKWVRSVVEEAIENEIREILLKR